MKYKTIMTSEPERCMVCGYPADEWHHIFHGTKGNKKISEDLGLMAPLCRRCHERVHHVGGGLDRELKFQAQIALAYDRKIPDEDIAAEMIKIFGRNFT